jgi:acyl carrier protein
MPIAIDQTVRDFVVENFLYRDEEPLGADTSFLETGLIDSTGVLELVGFLEETFEIKVADDEIVPENLDTLARITAYVQRKLGQTNGAMLSHAR